MTPLQLLQMMVVKDHGWRVVHPPLLLSTVVREMVEVMVDNQTELVNQIVGGEGDVSMYLLNLEDKQILLRFRLPTPSEIFGKTYVIVNFINFVRPIVYHHNHCNLICKVEDCNSVVFFNPVQHGAVATVSIRCIRTACMPLQKEPS